MRTCELNAASEPLTYPAGPLPVQRQTRRQNAQPVSANPAISTRLYASTGEPPAASTGIAMTPWTIIASE